MIANDLISAVVKHPRFKDAMEEMATMPLSEFGDPTVQMTCDLALPKGGAKKVRISIAMIDGDDSFDNDSD